MNALIVNDKKIILDTWKQNFLIYRDLKNTFLYMSNEFLWNAI